MLDLFPLVISDFITTHRQRCKLDLYLPNCQHALVVLNSVAELLGIDQTKDNPVDKFPFVGYGEALLEAFKGIDEPTVSGLRNILAIVYRNLGNYGQARELLEATLLSDLKNFGPDHTTVAIRYNNLAHVEIRVEEWLAAKEHLQQALTIGLRVWGEEHPNTQSTRQTLAFVEKRLREG